MNNRHRIKEGDTGIPLVAILKDEKGKPFDLSGATVIFRMKLRGGANLKVNRPALVANQTTKKGEVSFTFVPGEVTPGTYDVEFHVTLSNGGTITLPRSSSQPYGEIVVVPKLV